MRKKRFYAGCFVLHFLFLLLISGRQALSVVAEPNTFLPRSWHGLVDHADAMATAALGEDLAPSNPLRQGIAAYTHSAGMATGYSFFAPTVAVSQKLVFEVKFPDGRVEYELPRVGGSATGARLPLLFENIARTRYADFRETMLRMMAYSIWREHPDATVIRAVFGVIILPDISDFERGQRESYQFLYAYDFSFSPPDTPAPLP